jgi:hypothetical protein
MAMETPTWTRRGRNISARFDSAHALMAAARHTVRMSSELS